MASGKARTSVIFISEIAEPELLPPGTHPRLVLRSRPHGRRESLPAPLLAALGLPRPGRVVQDAVPEPGAERRSFPSPGRLPRAGGGAAISREHDEPCAA